MPRSIPVKAPPPEKALPPLNIDPLITMDTDSEGRLHVSRELEMAAHYEHLNAFVSKAMLILQKNDPTSALFEVGLLCDSLRSRHRFLGLSEHTKSAQPDDAKLVTSLTAQPCSFDRSHSEMAAAKRRRLSL